MGKPVDTSNLAETPSQGAAALMALAGFSAAHHASSTTAEPIIAHAHEQTAPPPKTVSQVLGEIAWLMTQSPRHKTIPPGDLECLVMPPFGSGSSVFLSQRTAGRRVGAGRDGDEADGRR